MARLLDGSLEGDDERIIVGVAGLEDAGDQELSFCALPRYRSLVATTAAAGVIVDSGFEPPRRDHPPALIRVEDTYRAVASAVTFFFPDEEAEAGIHGSAVVAASAELGEGVAVGPRAVIGEGCRIGSGTRIGAGCVLAAGVSLGEGCALYPNVTLYRRVRIGDRVIVHAGAVIGADGFGYAAEGDRRIKIPQVGGVVIEDDVEIGANACIDRGAFGPTRILRGTKIDNLVQIGHNCIVGPDSVLCGQVGLGGSTKVGKGVLIGGQAGLAGHMSVGDGAIIAADAGVTSSIPAGQTVAGYPHLEVTRWRRAMAALRGLPGLVRRVRRLEAAVAKNNEKEEA